MTAPLVLSSLVGGIFHDKLHFLKGDLAILVNVQVLLHTVTSQKLPLFGAAPDTPDPARHLTNRDSHRPSGIRLGEGALGGNLAWCGGGWRESLSVWRLSAGNAIRAAISAAFRLGAAPDASPSPFLARPASPSPNPAEGLSAS